MDTLLLDEKLSKFKACFIGTFARDKLPKIKITIRPSFLIMNTDTSENPGEHWVAILIGNDIGEYFDSFGITPNYSEIFEFFQINEIKNIIYNPYQLQSIITSTCGAYCVLYIKLRCMGASFCDFINMFTDDKIQNDLKAYLSVLT